MLCFLHWDEERLPENRERVFQATEKPVKRQKSYHLNYSTMVKQKQYISCVYRTTTTNQTVFLNPIYACSSCMEDCLCKWGLPVVSSFLSQSKEFKAFFPELNDQKINTTLTHSQGSVITTLYRFCFIHSNVSCQT